MSLIIIFSIICLASLALVYFWSEHQYYTDGMSIGSTVIVCMFMSCAITSAWFYVIINYFFI